jgi:zinc transport system ATP-binding protein
MAITTEEKPIITLEDVCAGYDEDTILEGVNFEMYPRDYVGLIGPNGGGKTTLIKVILGLIKPWCGSVRIFGKEPLEGRGHIGYVPQLQTDDKNFPISIWEVVQMGRLGRGSLIHRMRPEDERAIEEKLRWVNLLDIRKKAMGELSGGQRQRVYIARALATEPDILLLDEPTTSVDVEASTNLYELLRELNEQIAILLISHDMSAISTYVKTIGCVNRRLIYHREKQITADMLAEGYKCPVDLIAHGIPHRVLHNHTHDEEKNK